MERHDHEYKDRDVQTPMSASERLIMTTELHESGDVQALVSELSHALRGPLGAISNAAYLLETKLTPTGDRSDGPDEATLRAIRTVRTQVRLAAFLLAAAQQASVIEPPDGSPVDWKGLLEDAADRFRSGEVDIASLPLALVNADREA